MQIFLVTVCLVAAAAAQGGNFRNFHAGNGQNSYSSSFQSGPGSSVSINHHTGPDNKKITVIDVTNPNIHIDDKHGEKRI